MAERDDIAHQHDRLPIKLILPAQGKEKPVQGGGSPPKPFRTVDDKYRQRLYTQVLKIREAVVPQVKSVGSAPMRVKLITEASAKSHRPERIFSPTTCPIIGAGRLGELFMKATPQGLNELSDIIENNRADQVVKELSCVQTIEPITPADRKSGLDSKDGMREIEEKLWAEVYGSWPHQGQGLGMSLGWMTQEQAADLAVQRFRERFGK